MRRTTQTRTIPTTTVVEGLIVQPLRPGVRFDSPNRRPSAFKRTSNIKPLFHSNTHKHTD